MSERPTGTVTFLFTDIEGSTRRWEANPTEMQTALRQHDTILRNAIEEQEGYVFKTMGDAFCAAFSSPTAALRAALAAQRALYSEEWPGVIDYVAARMALHSGIAELQNNDYFGQPLNRVARMLSAGHGGQTLLSTATYEMVRDNLPAGVRLLDLGEHRLKDLFRPERIFQVIAPDLPSAFPPLKSLDNHPNNLPEQLAPFIGRERQIAQVVGMLQGQGQKPGTRLLTLTGPGGTGKTRIALQVGAEMTGEMEDGVWFINLAPISDPSLVASEIAHTLQLKEGGQPLVETLKDYLREKELLLILDNFEQVVESATVIADLLKAAPNVKAIVTSRVPLHLSGEQEYSVPPLDLPDRKGLLPPVESLTQYEAVALFIQRGQLVRPDFRVTNDNAPAVAEICYRLDGLPLAIELAASRIKFFPPQALLTRLESRLKTLTGGARDLPARQQTLQNAIEWSYELLSEEEKKLFRRLAVFVGGRSIEAAEAVCRVDGDLGIDVLDGILSLVDKSLLRQEEGAKGEPRFVMLETIHEFAREKLAESGEEEQLRRSHRDYFLAMAEESKLALNDARRPQWLAMLHEEHDNLRAACEWSLLTDGPGDDYALRISSALQEFWMTQFFRHEARQRWQLALSSSETRSPARVDTLVALANVTYHVAELDEAERIAEEGLALARELEYKQGIADSLGWLVESTANRGRSTDALTLAEEALAIRRDLGAKREKFRIVSDMTNLSWIVACLGDFSRARSLAEEALSISRAIGYQRGIGDSLEMFGTLARARGDYKDARDWFGQSLATYRKAGIRGKVAVLLQYLGFTLLRLGEVERAADAVREQLLLNKEAGMRGEFDGGAFALSGGVAVARGNIPDGTRLLAFAQSLMEARGEVLDPLGDRADFDHLVATGKEMLTEEEWRTAWEEGSSMSREEAFERAMETVSRVT